MPEEQLAAGRAHADAAPYAAPQAGAGDSPTTLQTLRALESGPRGLTEAEAEARLARFGENSLPTHRSVSLPRRFLHGLRDPFTAVLLLLGLVSALVASWATAAVITALVSVSCVLRASGERRADRAMARLRELVTATATVLRRPDEDAPPVAREIAVGDVVPGDVVRLGPGDLVPADVRLLKASGLRVNQAALTGESAPVDKHPRDVPSPRALGPFGQPHLCFQGSDISSGSGTAVVTGTGPHTRFAAAHTEVGPQGASAFDTAVRGVSWILVRFMLLTPPLVLMANAALRGRGLETLPFAVAVAVALTPEMLPVVVTTCLARGAALLARTHGVIVKRLPALHDLGAVDVLCLDKTGTLTDNQPVVDGAFGLDGRPDPRVLEWAAVNSWWTLHLADLPVPDALDEAILNAAEESQATGSEAAGSEAVETGTAGNGTDGNGTAGTGSVEDMAQAYDPVAVLPFDPVRRLATAVVRVPGTLGVHTLVVKGAVEHVMDRCVFSAGERERARALADRFAGEGLRVLAIATAERRARPRGWTTADERALTFRGFVTVSDAVTDTAATALRDLAGRGVDVKVLTGDHPATTVRTCRELGLDVTGVLTSDRIAALTDAELATAAARTTVFARCTPDDKVRIVTALRAEGHTTGFLGDGVNDLPAMRAADVGICPHASVDVVRESADVVLTGRDKDLTAIDDSIAAGRRAGSNISTYLSVTLSSNIGNVIAMLAAGALLPFLPMLPAQVLVQNLCFDAAQIAFAYDRPDPAALRAPTVLRARRLLRFITGFGLLNALADLATFGLLALALYGPGSVDDETAFHSGWFTENLLTQALVMVLLRTGCRAAALRGPGPVGWAATGLAAAGVLLPLSPLGPLLGMTALPLPYYLELAAVLVLYAVVLRMAVRRYDRRHALR